MKVLVTGDKGKLGSLTARALSATHTVVGFDIKRGSKEDLLNSKVQFLLEKMKGCDCVVHAAALPYPELGPFNDYFRVNVMGTLRIAQAAVEAKVRRIVYFSSIAYYGPHVRGGKMTPLYFPIDEQHPSGVGSHVQGGYESYDISKILAEQVLSYFGTNKMVEVIILRIVPANSKARQYRGGFNWRKDKSFRRSTFLTNCDPSYVAQATKLAVELEGVHWYTAFNIADRFTHKSVDVREFLEEAYPEVEVREVLGPRDSLISTKKAQTVLGFRPCEDLV